MYSVYSVVEICALEFTVSHGKKIFGFLLRGGIAAVVGYCLLVLGADWFAKSQFGTTIDGDWFLLWMASGTEELR